MCTDLEISDDLILRSLFRWCRLCHSRTENPCEAFFTTLPACGWSDSCPDYCNLSQITTLPLQGILLVKQSLSAVPCWDACRATVCLRLSGFYARALGCACERSSLPSLRLALCCTGFRDLWDSCLLGQFFRLLLQWHSLAKAFLALQSFEAFTCTLGTLAYQHFESARCRI